MNIISKKLAILFFCIFVFFLAGNVVATSGESADSEETTVEIQRPNIEIPIPGFIGFSEVEVEDGTISLPWIGEYFLAIFNWLMAIVAGVATTMIMIGGFIYLTAAGNATRAGNGKTIIINAVIGLLLAFGSYLILYTINPELVTFKNIRLSIIERSEIDFDNNPVEDQEGNVSIGDMAATGNFGGTAASNWTELRNLAGCTRTPYESRDEALAAFNRATQAFIASRGSVDYVSGGSPNATTCGSCASCDAETLSRVQAKTNICLDCATFTRALFTCLGYRNITVSLPPLYSEENRPYYRRFQEETHPDPEKNEALLEMYQEFMRTSGARGTSAMVRGQQPDFASATEFVRRVQSGEVVLQPGDMIVNAAFQRTSDNNRLHHTTGHFVTSLDGNLNGNTIEVTSGPSGSLWRSVGSSGTFNQNANGGAVITRPLMVRYQQKMNLENNLNGIFPVTIIRVIR